MELNYSPRNLKKGTSGLPFFRVVLPRELLAALGKTLKLGVIFNSQIDFIIKKNHFLRETSEKYNKLLRRSCSSN